jgi:hypothetical protein
MADLEITIPFPILTPPEIFKVRYRKLPAGVFSSYQNEDNTPFTLTGLTSGDYQIEVIVVLADGTECPATSFIETVVEFTCGTFTVTQELTPYRLKIEHSGVIASGCGYNIGYRQIGSTGFANVHYNDPLPASPIYINIPFPTPLDLEVRITADQCNGKATICYDEVVDKPVVPPCVPMPFVEFFSIEKTRDLPNKVEEYYLQYKFRATIPNCGTADLNISQTPIPPAASGVQGWTVSNIITVSSISGDQTRGLFIRYNGYSGAPFPRTWTFDLLDCCGVHHGLQITF